MTLMSAHLAKREEVEASVTGVSRSCQNRVDDETSAYFSFKDALMEGRVEIVN